MKKKLILISILNIGMVCVLPLLPIYKNDLGNKLKIWDVTLFTIIILIVFAMGVSIYVIKESLRSNISVDHIVLTLRHYIVYYMLIVAVLIIQLITLRDNVITVDQLNGSVMVLSTSTSPKFDYGLSVVIGYLLFTIGITVRVFSNKYKEQ